MSKPWDSEPTPLTNKYEMLARFGAQLDDIREYVVGANDVRRLERRMRAAERLLDVTINDTYPLVPAHDVLFDDIKSHLEAAKKENEQ